MSPGRVCVRRQRPTGRRSGRAGAQQTERARRRVRGGRRALRGHATAAAPQVGQRPAHLAPPHQSAWHQTRSQPCRLSSRSGAGRPRRCTGPAKQVGSAWVRVRTQGLGWPARSAVGLYLQHIGPWLGLCLGLFAPMCHALGPARQHLSRNTGRLQTCSSGGSAPAVSAASLLPSARAGARRSSPFTCLLAAVLKGWWPTGSLPQAATLASISLEANMALNRCSEGAMDRE